MDPWVEKQDKRDMKEAKAHYDRVDVISDAQWGIPDKCSCGGYIIQDVSPDPKYRRDFDTCKNYKDDGLHFRQPWVFGVEEEIGILKGKVESMAEELAKLKACYCWTIPSMKFKQLM